VSELPEVALDGIERMYADDLHDAVDAGKPFALTVDGERVAVVVPYRTMTALVRILTPLAKQTVRAVAGILGVRL
jgi:antitoxin (DNA-binding transcriptional repressor) of toxin-antitoxin stability system